MTRETKVGLLIGTLILLLVGIVVSDHLAVKEEHEQLASQYPGIQPESVVAGAANPDGTGSGPAANGDTSSGNSSPVIPTVDEIEHDQNLHHIPGVRQRNVAQGNGGRNSEGSGSRGTGDTGNIDRNNARNSTGRDTGNAGGTDLAIRNGNNQRVPIIPGNSDGRDAGNSAAGPNNTHVQPVIHYVKDGETLWAIAQKYYGDGGKWKIIADHNKDKLLAGNNVRGGVRLQIPNRVAQGAADANNARIANANDRARNAPAGNTITVKAGDNLSQLAQKYLGSTRHVKLLLEANRDKIRNANQIRVGMVLRVPAVPTPAASSPSPATRPSSPTAPSVNTSGLITHASPGGDSSATATTAPAATSRIYKVQDGDTFTSVAEDSLGNGARWKEIWKLNRVAVPDPNVLPKGVALKLPAR